MLLKSKSCCDPKPGQESAGCCSPGQIHTAGCCQPAEPGAGLKSRETGPAAKHLLIDFLFLDLSVCERCQGTDKNLDDALEAVSAVLTAAGYSVTVNKVNVITEELARKYKFLSSPTIRINGRDIAVDFKENNCCDCGDLCGDTVDCRVFTYEDNEYNTPPKEMIINALLSEVYGAKKDPPSLSEEYVLPENLRIFFEGQKKK